LGERQRQTRQRQTRQDPETAHHVDELGDGQSKLDDDHVGHVGHGPRPLVVADEELGEQLVFGVLLIARNCGWSAPQKVLVQQSSEVKQSF